MEFTRRSLPHDVATALYGLFDCTWYKVIQIWVIVVIETGVMKMNIINIINFIFDVIVSKVMSVFI